MITQKRKKKTVEDSRRGPPGGIEAGPLPGGRPNGGGGSCPGRPANLNRAVSFVVQCLIILDSPLTDFFPSKMSIYKLTWKPEWWRWGKSPRCLQHWICPSLPFSSIRISYRVNDGLCLLVSNFWLEKKKTTKCPPNVSKLFILHLWSSWIVDTEK